MAFELRNSEEQSPENSYIACTERAVRGQPPGQRVFCRWLGIHTSALSSFAPIRGYKSISIPLPISIWTEPFSVTCPQSPS